jgi:hypothetical protein
MQLPGNPFIVRTAARSRGEARIGRAWLVALDFSPGCRTRGQTSWALAPEVGLVMCPGFNGQANPAP